MNIFMVGACGFLGTNIALKLSDILEANITIAGLHTQEMPFSIKNKSNIQLREMDFFSNPDFCKFLAGQEIVYHLASSNIPTTSNQQISLELLTNISATLNLLDACVKSEVKKIVFVSSGGTIYGKNKYCPLSEELPTYPITSYGLQKLTIEKILFLYHYKYGLDYRVIRLSNPYGPYQRPNGKQGVITTFVYKTLKNEVLEVFGDGSVIRDYIYIDDAVNAILNIIRSESKYKTYNVGSGIGISIKELIDNISNILKITPKVIYKDFRDVDVPVNFLDTTRYKNEFGELIHTNLQEGIRRTADFFINIK